MNLYIVKNTNHYAKVCKKEKNWACYEVSHHVYYMSNWLINHGSSSLFHITNQYKLIFFSIFSDKFGEIHYMQYSLCKMLQTKNSLEYSKWPIQIP